MVRRVGSLVLVLAGVGSLGLVASGCHSDGDGDRRPTSDGSGSTNTEATGAVLFASGFEGSTQVTTTGQVQVDDIAGVDSAGGPSDWGRDLDDRPEIGAFAPVDPSQLGSGSSNQANPTTPELPPNQVPAPNGAPPAPPGAPPLPNTTPPTPPGPPPPTGGQVPVPPGPPPLPPDQVPSPNTTPTG